MGVNWYPSYCFFELRETMQAVWIFGYLGFDLSPCHGDGNKLESVFVWDVLEFFHGLCLRMKNGLVGPTHISKSMPQALSF